MWLMILGRALNMNNHLFFWKSNYCTADSFQISVSLQAKNTAAWKAAAPVRKFLEAEWKTDLEDLQLCAPNLILV